MRKDNLGVEPKIGDKIAYNPPYYKGLVIAEVIGEKKGSGLPIVKSVRYPEATPKTGFIVIKDTTEIIERLMLDITVMAEHQESLGYVDDKDIKTTITFVEKLQELGYYNAPEWGQQTPEDKEKVKSLMNIKL